MIGTSQRMMTVWCWAMIVFGAGLMGAAFGPTDGPTSFLFNILGGVTLTWDTPLRFAVGLMGAVTFGWGLTVLAVTSVSHLLETEVARLLWRRIATALGAWYVVDCAISITNGFGLNAVSNTMLTAAFFLIALKSGILAPPRIRRQSRA